MKKVLLFCAAIAFSLSLVAQTRHVDIQGTVVDTLGQGLVSATVVLLQAQDSVISSFGITSPDGAFALKRTPVGSYLIQVSYLGHDTYTQNLEIDNSNKELILDPILLSPAVALLGEVNVTADRIPIRINKDTIEYNADAFKTQPTDVVEDLLKKLPGIEVESDGTIKAHGEEVEQVLVDGKEFFGSDAQIATKNLPASSVDKVQVFDKQSDEAEFSGIDDGEEQKTINLELKEDYKQGAFGNLLAGYGTEDRYQLKANINRFDKTQQLSFIGMMNNINQQGFSMDDYVGFSGGLGGGRRSSGLPISDGLSNGFINTASSGINLNRDFGKKTDLNTSYFFSRIKNDTDQESQRESILAESAFLSEEASTRESVNANHRFNLSLEHKFDSIQNLKARATLSFTESDFENTNIQHTRNDEGIDENESNTDNFSNGNNVSLTSELIYRRRLRKKGRTLTIRGSAGFQDNEKVDLLESINTIFGRDMSDFIDTINQDQDETNDQLSYGLVVKFTEPVAKNKFIGLSYSRQNFDDELRKDVYDVGSDASRTYVDALSNHYNRSYVYDRVDASLRWIKGKSNLNVTLRYQQSDLDGEIISNETNINKSYNNFLPRVSWDLDLATSRRITFEYRTNVREPSLTQLQPIVDNTDPFYLYTGNPDLKPEFSHRFFTRFFSFSQFSMTSFFAYINATYTEDKIVNSVTIDDNFRQVSRPINVDNDYQISSFFGLGMPLRFIKTRLNVHANFSYNKGLLFVNSIEDKTDRFTTSLEISFDNQNKDIFDIALGAGFSHSLTQYRVSEDLDQDYLNQDYFLDVQVNFLKSWAMGSKLDYTVYTGSVLNEDNDVPLWNAFLSKNVFNQKGLLKLSVIDLLNRNVGIDQSFDLNYVEVRRIKSLSRYFMLSLSYALNQMGAKGKSGRRPNFRMRHMGR